MTVDTSSPDLEAVMGFLDHLGVPVMEIEQPCDSEPSITGVNSAFQAEFSASDVAGISVAAAKVQESLPLKQVPQEPQDSDCIELDLIEHQSELYLRNRAWATGRLLDVFFPAESDLPHHRHIAVLHRVFRHNLRNGLNAISGWARIIQDEVGNNPDVVKKAATEIVDRSEQLAQISDEARRLRDLLHTDTKMQSRDLNGLVSCAVADCRRRFESPTIEADIPLDLSVRANEKLSYAFDNLIDNALRHNDIDDVTVRIEADTTASAVDFDAVRLRISDDGSGLNAVEREIVSGECDLDQLNHGSGLGLWLVSWILDAHDAVVDVDVRGEPGTNYTIYLPK